MSEREHAPTEKRNDSSKRLGGLSITGTLVGVVLLVCLAIFLIGFWPMWLRARERTEQRDMARRELRHSQTENKLASAAIDARRGDYEPARQAASDFFTALREQVDASDESSLTQAQRDNFKTLLAQRDDIISLLARSDPAAADRLFDLYVAYRKAMSGAGQ